MQEAVPESLRNTHTPHSDYSYSKDQHNVIVPSPSFPDNVNFPQKTPTSTREYEQYPIPLTGAA